MVNIEIRLIIFSAAKDGEALYSQQKQDQKSRRRNSTTTFQWDGWMASLTRWTWVWVNSGSWWWTGGPGMLRFMGSQRIGHDWATELTDWVFRKLDKYSFVIGHLRKVMIWIKVRLFCYNYFWIKSCGATQTFSFDCDFMHLEHDRLGWSCIFWHCNFV